MNQDNGDTHSSEVESIISDDSGVQELDFASEKDGIQDENTHMSSFRNSHSIRYQQFPPHIDVESRNHIDERHYNRTSALNIKEKSESVTLPPAIKITDASTFVKLSEADGKTTSNIITAIGQHVVIPTPSSNYGYDRSKLKKQSQTIKPPLHPKPLNVSNIINQFERGNKSKNVLQTIKPPVPPKPVIQRGFPYGNNINQNGNTKVLLRKEEDISRKSVTESGLSKLECENTQCPPSSKKSSIAHQLLQQFTTETLKNTPVTIDERENNSFNKVETGYILLAKDSICNDQDRICNDEAKPVASSRSSQSGADISLNIARPTYQQPQSHHRSHMYSLSKPDEPSPRKIKRKRSQVTHVTESRAVVEGMSKETQEKDEEGMLCETDEEGMLSDDTVVASSESERDVDSANESEYSNEEKPVIPLYQKKMELDNKLQLLSAEEECNLTGVVDAIIASEDDVNLTAQKRERLSIEEECNLTGVVDAIIASENVASLTAQVLTYSLPLMHLVLSNNTIRIMTCILFKKQDSFPVENNFIEEVDAIIATDIGVDLRTNDVPAKFNLSDTEMLSIANAIRKNDMSKVEELVLKIYGSDVNKKSLCNILFIAAAMGSLECCQFLLDVEFTANALSLHESILKVLPNINCKTSCISPLQISVHSSKTEHVRLLLKYSNIEIIEKCHVLSKELEALLMSELKERLSEMYSSKAHVVAGYEDGSPVLVVYSYTEIKGIEHFGGKTVKIINPMHVNRQYSLSEAYHSETSPQMSTNDMTIARQIIKERSDELWETHSNLNIISMSATKYVQKEQKECACITLYCTSKGIIPLGESRFPISLCTRDGSLQLPVDIREGYFDFCPSYATSGASTFHEKLKMGCSVGKLQHPINGGGTIGPFVDVNGQTGFITCAHVLFDIGNGHVNYIDETLSRTSVVQPAVGSFMTNDQRGEAFRSVLRTPCGYVKKAKFNPHQETSIDAALVIITNQNRLPQAGHFAVDCEFNYVQAGFDDLPAFNTGITKDRKDVSTVYQVIKCGKTTHLTRGLPVAKGVEVRPLNVNLGLPSMTRTFKMKNQIIIASVSGHCAFFQPGDSGSAVFTVKEDRTLECIGMAIGFTSDHMAVVTPIKSILEALGPNIKLKKF